MCIHHSSCMCTNSAFQFCAYMYLRLTTHYHAELRLSRCLTIIMFSASVMLLCRCNAIFLLSHCFTTVIILFCCHAALPLMLLGYCRPPAFQSHTDCHCHAVCHSHASLCLYIVTPSRQIQNLFRFLLQGPAFVEGFLGPCKMYLILA